MASNLDGELLYCDLLWELQEENSPPATAVRDQPINNGEWFMMTSYTVL